MSEKPLTIMVDTNVWLDIFIPNRPSKEGSLSFFEAARDNNVELVYTLEIARAVFRIVSLEAKGWVRKGKGMLPDEYARAIASHAWDFIESMQELGTPVGSSTADLWLASKLRDEHADLEDNLIVAACMRLDVDYLVTSDAKLIHHAPVATATPSMMTKLLNMGTGR